MAAAERTVLYWRGGADVHLNLINALNLEGLKVEQLRDLDEVLDHVSRYRPLAVIVDGSASEREAANCIVELMSTPILYDHALVFLASKAESRVSTLEKQYQVVLPIETPLDVTVAMRELAGFLDVELGRRTNKEKEDKGDREPVGVSNDPTNVSKTYGGKFFARATDLYSFNTDLLLPTSHPNATMIKDVLNQLTDASGAVGGHARRATFVASAMANALTFGPDRDSNVRTTALLLNWGGLDHTGKPNKHLEWALDDIFLQPPNGNIEKIAKLFQHSANYIQEKLGDEMAARTVVAVSRMLQRKEVKEHREVVLDAQTAMVSEFADRACWQCGYWNPTGANRVIRNIRAGTLFEVDDRICLSVTRVLGEAVAQKAYMNAAFLAKLAVHEDNDKMAEINKIAAEVLRDAERLFGEDGIRLVPIADLLPGMRLARPVLSIDEHVILPANTELDNDLIWRLWQLTAIRPIKSPLGVAKQVKVEHYL